MGHRRAGRQGQPGGSVGFGDVGAVPAWRNLRVPLSAIPSRGHAGARSSPPTRTWRPQHWIAVTPPRIPQLQTLQDVVGREDPVLLDWLVGLAFPCQRPFGHQNGVTEVPKWRILPDRFGAEANSPVMDYLGGGPLGITELLVRRRARADVPAGRLVPRLGRTAEADAVVPERPARATRPRHRDPQRAVDPQVRCDSAEPESPDVARWANGRRKAPSSQSHSIEPRARPEPRSTRIAMRLAGIVGLLLCALTPLLPVKQTTAAILWPQGIGTDGLVTDVTAPLVSGAPLALDVTIPCKAVATLPAAGGVVFSTIPDGGIDAGRNGLFVRATTRTASSSRSATPSPPSRRGRPSTRAPAARCTSGPTSAAVGADFVGIPGATGTAARREEATGRGCLHRPEGRRPSRACPPASTSTPASSPPRPR